MKLTLFLSFSVLLGMAACTPGEDESSAESAEVDKAVRLMTLDPGHFHAGLVHKYDYDQVDRTVHIYAPDGQELESHLALIDRFNTRPEQPTHWVPVVYRGDDYLERMLEAKPGNVMVVAGNNGRKIGIHPAGNRGRHPGVGRQAYGYSPRQFSGVEGCAGLGG